jgi:hypothetical protein
VVETASGRQWHQARRCWRRGTQWRGRAPALGTQMGERGLEEGCRRQLLTVEPATGGRGDQTGRERHAGDRAATASVCVSGRCALQGGRGGGRAREREG